MSDLILAQVLADLLHAKQTDKAGKPYIEHVKRVAARVMHERIGGDAVIVAYLHDLVEDTPCTFTDLSDLRFSVDVVNAVRLLTRRDDETYDEYIDAICKATGLAGHYARVVKISDLADHLLNPEVLSRDEIDRYETALGKFNG